MCVCISNNIVTQDVILYLSFTGSYSESDRAWSVHDGTQTYFQSFWFPLTTGTIESPRWVVSFTRTAV